ncbi:MULTISPECIES: metalloendopeptidase [Bacillus cereus group]|uniref:metalloendopeptidase n=1 Tax=Bacillus cereus group TaxID=86661 RepID=UPI000B442F6A|nr:MULTISPECIES: metalloendopeptidase [Bacillus cereus group]OTX37323.1 metalloendopeptidase [Bacillus thuringiensis serovar malayensis]OUB01887.1 metalloendopeptidase [Bacillus thuringiensis serovar shandongiensis]MDH4420356.1 metalloendopeptidase [Bacillus cereus]MEC2391047.1 metalloendopeptidase [Bacillus toyonensis]PEK54874.1 metalloendopeptidase [Bacillus toyonensis]
MLFQINRDELNEVIAGYQPHKHTKKAIQGFQKDMTDIEKYAASIEKEKAEKQLQLTKVLVDMEATFEIGERIYLQNEQEHLSKELQALDFFLEETKERTTQVRLKHAPAVAQAIDKDRSELLATFNEEMNRAVRVALSDVMDCVADVSKMLESEQKEFEHDVYDCLAGDSSVTEAYNFQNKTIKTSTPLEIGYLQIMPSHFLEATKGNNTVKSNSFIIRDYGQEGGE